MKLKMEEFCLDFNFKYGVPVLILDIIQAFTGYDFLTEIKQSIAPFLLIPRLNPDDDAPVKLQIKFR